MFFLRENDGKKAIQRFDLKDRGGGDDFIDAKAVPGGLLGADYEISNGHYRFKKVYGGLNWNPSLRAPLTEPD